MRAKAGAAGRRVRFSERLDEPFAPVLDVSSVTCEHGGEQMFDDGRHETRQGTPGPGATPFWGRPHCLHSGR